MVNSSYSLVTLECGLLRKHWFINRFQIKQQIACQCLPNSCQKNSNNKNIHVVTAPDNNSGNGINNFMTLVILNLCFQIKFSKMKKICHLKRSATALRSFQNQAIPFPMMKAVPVTLAHTAVSKLQLSIITFHIMKCINSQPYVFGLQFSWKQRRY